jgi:protein-disulfide isomerase
MAVLISATVPALAQQQAAGQNDGTTMTRQQADEIMQQLRVLRQLLEKQHSAQPEETKVPDTGYSLGQGDAPVTLVEFSDYQCPFCAQFQNETFEKLRQDYVQAGKMRFVIRDLPLPSHGDALKAAEAARCGGDQGKFWEVRNALVAHFKDLKQDSLLVYAQQLGLDMARFKQCLDSNKFLPEIQQDEADAKAAGITMTPSFVLGKADRGVVDGVRLVGAMPYGSFAQQIAKELATPGKPAGHTTEVSGETTPLTASGREIIKQ